MHHITLETFVTIALYKSTFTIPCHTITELAIYAVMGLQDKGDEHPTYAPEGVQDCQVLFLNYKISTCSYVPVHDLLSQLFKCGYKEMSS